MHCCGEVVPVKQEQHAFGLSRSYLTKQAVGTEIQIPRMPRVNNVIHGWEVSNESLALYPQTMAPCDLDTHYSKSRALRRWLTLRLHSIHDILQNTCEATRASKRLSMTRMFS